MSKLVVKPLGGVGEIGSNMTLVQSDNTSLIIDVGILFPYEDFFDLNYLIPDFKEQLDESYKLIITHGHEDHIGAIEHLVRIYPKIEIWAPAFAKTLMLKKLARKKLSCKINTYNSNTQIKIDKLTIDPIRVNHSIPDTYGLYISNETNSFFFASDFKVDLSSTHEKPFDFEKLEKLYNGQEKRVCFIDSTNILNKGKTLSEDDLLSDFNEVIASEKRVFITLFSSNIHRVKNIIQLAKDQNKKVIPIGRSLNHYIESALENKIISKELFKNVKEVDAVKNLQSSDNVFLLTGCQGEFRGALTRIANGEHSLIKFNSNDLVVFSSKAIPGNQKKVSRLINKIVRYGADVITEKEKSVHASGHPSQKDLILFIDKIKPTHYIPIHGESYFLKKHCEFIKENYPEIQNFCIENYDLIHIESEHVHLSNHQTIREPLLIHGNSIEIERSKISQRRKLACNGLIVISAFKKTKSVKVTFNGLPEFIHEREDDLIKVLKPYLQSKQSLSEIEEEMRIISRNFFKKELGYRPIVVSHVL